MWLLFSFLMFICSNALYLAIRKVQKENISAIIYSTVMFVIPAIVYFLLALTTKTSLALSLSNFVIVILTAFFWSYLGNYFSQKGILNAPNPGYSLILQKSYVIITTIAAIFLFGSSFSLLKGMGVIIILLFSAAMSISGKTHKAKLKWVIFSLAAHLCFALGSLMSKYFLNIGLQPYTYLFYINIFVGSLNFIQVKRQNLTWRFSRSQWLFLLLIGLTSVGFNLFMQLGYKFAPNPGYVVAINTASIMSLTLFSAYFFHDELSKQKLMGITGVFIGLLLIAFG